MQLDSWPVFIRLLAGVLPILIGLVSQGHGAEPAAEQIERATVLREMAEVPPPGRGDARAVLAPARLEIEQLGRVQQQAVTIDNDLRWRKLLADQARERHAPDAHLGATPIRALVDDRAQAAQALHRRMQRQDLEYRLEAGR